MQLKMRKIGNGYGVLLPKPIVEDLAVQENSLLTVSKVGGVYQLTPYDEEFTAQVEAFLRTEGRHRNTYRELAK